MKKIEKQTIKSLKANCFLQKVKKQMLSKMVFVFFT